MDSTYRATILKEIGIITKTVSGESIIPLRSIYFGGGTPSLAPIETLDAILSAVRDGPFCLDPNAEITIEMDPGTFSLSKLKTIKKLGFNRVSLGVQSFDDTILESIGRCHRREDIFESISLLHQVYGDNVNYSIDLISGLPGVSLAKWVETLEMATSLSPSHLSIYDLQVESGTVFGKWYNGQDGSPSRGRTQGSVPVDVPPLPSMEECAFCYKYASRYLRARGYEHYEISSFANKGNESSSSSSSVNRSQHNQIYWEYNSQWFGKKWNALKKYGYA
jgi:oxygen-independent coproporphyrinogen-3 oxidase